MSKKSTIVAGAGLLTGIFTRLVLEVERAGGDEESIHFLSTPGADDLWPHLANSVVQASTSGSSLLSLITMQMVPGVENFVVDNAALAKAKINHADRNFYDFFRGKNEAEVQASVVAGHRLKKDSPEGYIMNELGDNAIISLGNLFYLTERRFDNALSSFMGGCNHVVAFVKDKNEKTWASDVRWSDINCSWDLRFFEPSLLSTDTGNWPRNSGVLSRAS